jgi:hypothetical protein
MRLVLRLLPTLLLPLLVACSESNQEKASAEAVQAGVTQPASELATSPKASQTKSSSASTAPATDTTQEQAIAAFIGGMKPGQRAGLDSLTKQPAWQAFAADANKNWQKYTLTHTVPMTKWAASELDSVHKASPTIFYPFSGPDFLNVFTLFPTAQTYVMVGLEPVGSVPNSNTLRNPDLFKAVKASLWSVLNFSFFRTNDMAVDLKSVQLDGALPLIMLFAARTGNQIIAIRPVQLDGTGQLLAAPTDTIQHISSKNVPGAEVRIRAADGTEKTIYYFSEDISDGNLASHPALLSYVRTLGPLTTYVKSATYLMHKTYFSKVRNLILERSQYVLQDDSGIAMKYFPKDWQFTYYGTYKRPINLFAKHYQPQLTAAYSDSVHRPRPLPFGTGYNWRQTDSNLLLAHPKPKNKLQPAS